MTSPSTDESLSQTLNLPVCLLVLILSGSNLTLQPAPTLSLLGLPNEVLNEFAAHATKPSAIFLALTCKRLYAVVLHQRRRPILKKVCRKPRHYSPLNSVKQSQFDELMRLLLDWIPSDYGLCRGTRKYVKLLSDGGKQGGCMCPISLLRRRGHEVLYRGPWYETHLVTFDCCDECQGSWERRTGGLSDGGCPGGHGAERWRGRE